MTDDKMNKYLNPKSAEILAGLDTEKDGENDSDEEEVVYIVEPGSAEEAKGIEDAKRTLKAMYISFLFLTLIFAVAGLLLFSRRLTFLAGLLTGTVTGLFYIWHLNSSVRGLLDVSSERASGLMRRDATIRVLVVGAAGMLVTALVKGNAVLGVLAQFISLKLSVYLTPFVASLLEKKNA
ncbi:MAG: hypothetical protein ACI39R_04255 [Lachnospiraceae bacterium]